MFHIYKVHSLDFLSSSYPPASDNPSMEFIPTIFESHAHEIKQHAPDYIALCPMFGWLPLDIIQQKLLRSPPSMHGQLPMSTLLKKQYKSSFPALNVHIQDELVALTIYSVTPVPCH